MKNQGKGKKMRNLFPNDWRIKEKKMEEEEEKRTAGVKEGEGSNQKEEGNIFVIWVGFSRPNKIRSYKLPLPISILQNRHAEMPRMWGILQHLL